MAVLELKYGEDEILKTVCEEIREINDEIKQFSDDMLDTMYKYDGIGLAACQVGKTIRMITYDVSYIEEGAKKKPMVLINPKIIWKSKTLVKAEEGCLSYPDVFLMLTDLKKLRLNTSDLMEKREL